METAQLKTLIELFTKAEFLIKYSDQLVVKPEVLDLFYAGEINECGIEDQTWYYETSYNGYETPQEYSEDIFKTISLFKEEVYSNLLNLDSPSKLYLTKLINLFTDCQTLIIDENRTFTGITYLYELDPGRPETTKTLTNILNHRFIRLKYENEFYKVKIDDGITRKKKWTDNNESHYLTLFLGLQQFYLSSILSSLNRFLELPEVINSFWISRPISVIDEIRSFKLVNENDNFPILTDLYNYLNNDLIDSGSLGQFRDLFRNKKIESPIIWKGTNGELRLLIDSLESQGIIKIGKRIKWLTVCECFLTRNGEKFTVSSLREAKKPNDSDKIDRAIRLFRKSP